MADMRLGVGLLPWVVLIALPCLVGCGARTVCMSKFLRPDPAPAPLAYKTIGDKELQMWRFPPEGASPGELRPSVVFIHGGGWRAGNADVFFPHARYFASRGMTAFSVNYRLFAPGGATLRDCIADCASAMRYIRVHAAELGVDPARIAVAGDSAGGHLAAALGTLKGLDDPGDDMAVSALPNAMVLCNPIVDMTEGGWIDFVIGARAADASGPPRPTEDERRRARQLSPAFNVRPGQAPTLLMHGLNDNVVSPDQARRFAAASAKAGSRCDLVLIEGARHAFIIAEYTASEASVVAHIRTVDRFLASLGYLRGEPTLVASDPPAWVP